MAISAMTPIAYGQDADVEKAQARVERLEQLGNALQQVRIDQKEGPTHRVEGERRYSVQSELHFRFLICVTALENDHQDALLLFPWQISGLTSRVDGQVNATPLREIGSDMKKIRIEISRFFEVGKAKAKIEVPNVNHGSIFNAEQLARDEIQKLLEQYLPDVEIDGMRRLEEKEVVVKNETNEPLTVWVFWRQKVLKDESLRRSWLPSTPEVGDALKLTVPAGSQRRIEAANSNEEMVPIAADRVRIWAESESGEQWLDYRDQNLLLVDKNPELGGDRAYHAEKLDTYTHVIKPHPGPREFAERLIELQNAAPEDLDVRLRYLSMSGNEGGWRDLRVTIPAGETLALRDGDGMRVRASRFSVVAESPNRRYLKHERDPLWTVEEADGRRLYQEDKIGSYTYIFNARGEHTARRSAAVVGERAEIKLGNTVLANATRGQSFDIEEVRGDWLKVQFKINGESKSGWINARDVKVTDHDARPAVAGEERSLVVTSNDAGLMQGTHRISTLARGARYPVLEQNGNWYRIEVTVQGTPRHGWVRGDNIRME